MVVEGCVEEIGMRGVKDDGGDGGVVDGEMCG